MFSFNPQKLSLNNKTSLEIFKEISETQDLVSQLNEKYYNKLFMKEKIYLDNKIFNSREALKLGLIDRIVLEKTAK